MKVNTYSKTNKTSGLITKSSIVIFLMAIACQLTDVSLGPIKIWELLAISIFPLYIKKIELRLLLFLFVFSILLILSILKGVFSDLNYANTSGLKSKYMISIVRYIELVLCLVVASIPFNLNKRFSISCSQIIKRFLDFSVLITIAILICYGIDVLAKTALVSYGIGGRLRAFYVEGGPYGLFISTLIFIELSLFKRKLNIAILSLALFLSQSKAGGVAIALFILLYIIQNNSFLRSFIRPRNFIRFSLMLGLLAVLGSMIMYKIGSNYVEDINNINQSLDSRGDDPSLVMGRIAASYIGPNIIKDNPLVGVGLGAYSLVRNDSLYRGPFPIVDGWDLTGMGGAFNLLIENGFIGLLLFSLCIIRYFTFDNTGIYFLMLFILPFLLGAQLYMVYPWLYLGFYSVYRKEYK